MEIVAGYIIKAFVLPPGVNLFALVFGMLFMRRSPRLRRIVVAGAIGTLWLWSTPFVAGWQGRSLERHAPLDLSSIGDAQAIIVLSGGRYTDAPEYDGADTIADDTLERVRYGAKLARDLRLPVAVTGGSVIEYENAALGSMMAQVLREEFQTPVRWVEERSRNTAQNASELRALLPVQHIILVTHAIHMPRAISAFERVGFTVTAAPMGFRASKKISYSVLDWLPSMSALVTSRSVLHEWIGMTYYRMRYG